MTIYDFIYKNEEKLNINEGLIVKSYDSKINNSSIVIYGGDVTVYNNEGDELIGEDDGFYDTLNINENSIRFLNGIMFDE